jgi:murein DD-endopeptidase MepM/ murein hydrolase activator NlpD
LKKGKHALSSLTVSMKNFFSQPVFTRPLTGRHIVGMAMAAVAAFYFAIQSIPVYESKTASVSAELVSAATSQPNGQADAGNSGKADDFDRELLFHQSLTAQVRKGDTLFDLLKENGIPPIQIHELVLAARPVHNLGRLQQGQVVMVDYDKRDGTIYRFETDLKESKIIVERQQDQMSARKEDFDFEIKHHVIAGTIQNSLFLAADEAGLSPSLILALAEIFAWDIDFHCDIRSGDSFIVLFEEKHLDGHPTREGRILAAAIENDGKQFWAFYHEGKNGRGDYYDEKGHALRKAFLKSPLKYTRISSTYSKRRFHPILKIYRPHLGVDYAAPAGTPIRSIGDGRIVYAGWKSGYGRYIKIHHNNTYSSTYGHMRSFAKGISQGKHVSQGDVIGYVGQTGLATGPHLDFRLMKNDKFVNPLTVNLPNADPIAKDEMNDFNEQIKQYVLEISNQASPPSSPPFQMISLKSFETTL